MGKINKNIAISAILASQIFTSVAADESDIIVTTPADHNRVQSDLLIYADSECLKYSAMREECDPASLNLELVSEGSFWQFSFSGSAEDEGDGYSKNISVDEMTIGLHNDRLSFDVGLFEVEHPVITTFDSGINRYMAPISLDNALRRQGISDQVGLRLNYNIPLSQHWSASVNLAATQSKYMHFGNDLSPQIYGRENAHALLAKNEIYPERYIAAVENFELPQIESYTVDDFRAGRVPQIYLSDLKDNLETFRLSEHGQNFAKFAAWLHLEHGKGWRDVARSIDAHKIAQAYNNFRANTVDDINGLSLPDNLQQEIMDRLGDYISGDQAAEIEDMLQNALSGLKDEANSTKPITAKEIRAKLDEVFAGLQNELNDEILSNPDVYYPIYRDTLRHMQDLYKSYQTVSDTPSYHANIEIARYGEDVDWRLGALWNQLASGSSETVAEERYGLYSILDWRFADKWAYQNITALDYYKNHLGLEGIDSGSALFYNRLSHAFNNGITPYIALGASAEPVDGAFITGEIGAMYAWQIKDEAQLMLQVAYEENKAIDVGGKEFMGIEDAEGHGTKVNLTYQMSF